MSCTPDQIHASSSCRELRLSRCVHAAGGGNRSLQGIAAVGCRTLLLELRSRFRDTSISKHSEDSTPRRTHRTRGTDACFSRARVVNAHALAQDLTVKDMLSVCLRALIKIHSFVSWFVSHCLGHSSLRPLRSHHSGPHYNSAQTPLLNTAMSQKPRATPQGVLIFGRLAEQSPLTHSNHSLGHGRVLFTHQQETALLLGA